MLTRDVISFFSKGGKILTDFLGGGRAKYKKNKIVCAKTQKNTISQIQGGGNNPHRLSTTNVVPDAHKYYLRVRVNKGFGFLD